MKRCLLLICFACAPADELSDAPPPLVFDAPKADAGDTTPDGGEAPAPTDAGTPDTGQAPPADAGQPPTPDTGVQMPPPAMDLSGTWALRSVTSQFATVPIIGETQSTATGLGLVQLAQSGTEVTYTLETCALIIPPQSGASTTYPPEAVDAVPIVHGSASLSAADVGATFDVPPYTSFIGWEPDSLDDAIPQNAEDPRVIDADNDGNPGVTILVSGLINSEVYIVNKSVAALSGTVTSEDLIEGLNDSTSEQVILDATNPLVPAGPVDSRPDPDPNNSTFSMVRIDPSQDCAFVEANQDNLFP